MNFLEQFTLYDVFLVALGLIIASIVRIFYDSYQERKRLNELDELVTIYNESMNAHDEGVLIISDKNEIVFSNIEVCRILNVERNALDYSYLNNMVRITFPNSVKEKSFLSSIEEKKIITHAQIIIGSITLPVSVHSNTFYMRSENRKDGLWRIITIQDITRKIKLQEKIESTGLSKDILTGLPMKYHMTGKLLSTILRASQNKEISALGMLSIENYHILQAMYGMDKIDTVIKKLVKVLSDEVDEEEMLYRFDHDNFAIIFTKISNTIQLKERLKELKLLMDSILSKEKIESTTLVGFTLIAKPYPSVDQAIHRCLHSLYSGLLKIPTNIKTSSKTLVDSYAKKHIPTEKLGKKEFEQAIANNDFFFFYQPIYALKENKLIGVEVLTRLNYKKEGLIYPEIFLEQAIECNMMTELTSHLLDHVLSQKQFWTTQLTQPLEITINLSISDINSGIFTETLERKILEYDIDPKTIIIDISEDIFEENFKAVFEECYMLDKLGVRLIIDHFGKGCITLKNLSLLPLSAIKLDGLLVQGIEEDDEKVKLAKGITLMAKNLNMEVGATFIDSEAVKIVLEDVGCVFAQGNYLGKAAPAFEIADIIHSR